MDGDRNGGFLPKSGRVKAAMLRLIDSVDGDGDMYNEGRSDNDGWNFELK